MGRCPIGDRAMTGSDRRRRFEQSRASNWKLTNGVSV